MSVGNLPEHLRPLLRLSLVQGVGPERLESLIHRFGSAEGALAASTRELGQVPGIGPELARRVHEMAGPAGERRFERALGQLGRVGGVVVTREDACYPDAFGEVAEPPYLLFAAGDPSLLERRAVAIVGTRRPTDYGRAVARELGRELARRGYVIVSGMARGIDSVAHDAALAAGGGTIGILGHGIEGVYPRENRPLFGAVRERGLLITEFAPGERPKMGNFPRRNRLIAALAAGIVVVEMGLKSGAQHTVTYALDQGRDVMAVPGPIHAPASAGTNQLIRQGARLVTSAEDVLEEIEGVGRGASIAESRPMPEPVLPLLSPAETRVYETLALEPVTADDLTARAALDPGPLLGALLELELKGLAESLPGNRFRRV